MKTSVFKLICSVFAVSLLMSSCLGDSDNSVKVERELALIKIENYTTKCAVTANGYITNASIQDLREDRCYYIAYKITSSGASGNVYNAEYINVIDPDPVPQTYLMENNLVLDGDAISSLGVGRFSMGDYFGDKWQFFAKIPLKEGEGVNAQFYYDSNNQKSETGDDLEKNQVIIDVRFTKTNVNSNNVTAPERDIEVIGDFSELRRTIYKDKAEYTDADGYKYANVAIKFRYTKIKANTTTGETEIGYLGTLSTSGTNTYVMQFYEEK